MCVLFQRFAMHGHCAASKKFSKYPIEFSTKNTSSIRFAAKAFHDDLRFSDFTFCPLFL
jgi:hypothetical protein